MRRLTSTTTFLEGLENVITEVKTSEKFLRSAVSDSSKYLSDPRFENEFVIRTKSTDKLVALSILSWYFSDEIRPLVQMNLQEKWNLSEDSIIGEFLLNSFGEMKLFLLETTLWSERDFFGNIFSKNIVLQLLGLFRPKFASHRRPKRIQRHRGYRDKGTLKFPHEYHDFASRSQELKEEEEQRLSRLDQIDLARGWIT